MEQLVILSQLEQEYLVRAIEAALHVRELRQFFLWTQGQFQALLPHEIMVGLQFGAADELQYIECVHGTMLDAAALRQLCHPQDGLAVRIARAARAGQSLPAMLQADQIAPGHPLAPFQAELLALQLENIAVHGSERRLAGSSTFFILCRLPHKPGARQAYFLELLLPYLHMALLRLAGAGRSEDEGAGEAERSASQARPLSAREIEILHWVREGKSNHEIGTILGISGLTVKNHLQRVYRAMGVSNRTQAAGRAMALRA